MSIVKFSKLIPKKTCQCGSTDILFVFQKGGNAKHEAFCDKCISKHIKELKKINKKTSKKESPET